MSGNSTCKHCGEFIRWKPNPVSHGYTAINADGTSHWTTCITKANPRATQIIIAPHKFNPLLDDLKRALDDIEEKDNDGFEFLQRLLLEREAGKLHQITEKQFEWVERLHEEYCA